MTKNDLTSRLTRRHQNWYLRGWEYREVTGRDGKPRQKLVYTREYYKLSLERRRRARTKALASAMFLLLCGIYLFFMTTRSQGGFVWYAGAPCLLAVIPLFYLGLGVWNLALTEEYFTYRRLRAAFFRLRVGGTLSCILLGIGTLGQLVFILIYRRVLTLKPELIMLFGALLCTALSAGLVLLTNKTPFEEVSPKEYPGENRGN